MNSDRGRISQHEPQMIPICREDQLLYQIILSQTLEGLGDALSHAGIRDCKVCIVTDSHVGPLYAGRVREIIQHLFEGVFVFTFPAGEENKTLDTVQDLYEYLIGNHFERRDLLLALGGGVTGDLTGFAAATYLRGIRFVQVPTSLLAQVDSSIGGKTGVDFRAFKNMVGAFHQPSLVYSSADVLHTLTDRQFLSGMGEILKHGLIRDPAYYQWLRDNREKILDRDSAVLTRMISRSDEIKKMVVERDPLEQGERAILNFGHTLGHAVEKLMDFQLLHGECVAIGMAGAAFLSMKRGMLRKEEYEDICQTLQDFGLPISVSQSAASTAAFSADDLVETTRSDKKMTKGKVRFILLDGIGNAVIRSDLTREELSEGALMILKANTE